VLSLARICSDSGISASVAVTLALISFVLAVLSWRFVEQPFRNSSTPTHLLLKRYAALAVAMTIPAILFWASGGLPQRNRQVQQMESSADPFRHDVCVMSYGVSHPMLRPPCVPSGQGRAVALIGDSHASALAGGLRPLAARQGYRLLEFTKSVCPPLQEVVPYSMRYPGREDECGEFNRETIGYILRDPSINVVVISGLWSAYLSDNARQWKLLAENNHGPGLPPEQPDALFQRGLNAEIGQLEQEGKIVYLLQDNNSFPFDPMRHMRTRLIAPRRALTRFFAPSTEDWPDGVAPPTGSPEEAEARRLVALVARAHPEVKVIDPEEKLCSTAGCRFALGNQTLFADSQHLSSLGAQIALSEMKLP
jgi:hypothetical protein